MKKFFEDLSDFIACHMEIIVITGALAILIILVSCLPICLIGDIYIKNRALDIYEETGIMISIDNEDIIETIK